MVRLPTQIELLGGLALVRGGERTDRFRTRKIAILLGYLALHLGRPTSRGVLADLLWPEDEPEAGRNSLRVALASLRRMLEPPPLEFCDALMANRADVWLREDQFETDVTEFRRKLARAARTEDAYDRIEQLLAALDLYQGELLRGLEGDWIDTARRELDHLYRTNAAQTIDLLLEQRRADEALPLALRLAAQDPFDEPSHSRLIQAHVALGRRSDAQASLDAFRSRMTEELNLEPSPEIEKLLDLPVQQPAERTQRPHATGLPAQPTALPRASTSFHGRAQELERLARASDPSGDARRLITLTGLGGIGKTRLALQTASENAGRFTGGVWFVPLAELKEGSELGRAISGAMRLKLLPHVDPMDLVLDELRTRAVSGPALLVLDNFEQLVESGRPVVERLRQGSPSLSLIVTSRARLRLPGELEIQVGPLDLPAPTDEWRTLSRSGGAGLFSARARCVVPDFQITERNAAALAELCRRLEGIPLAIELAASRVRVLTPGQILSELDQRFELLVNRRASDSRHRSLAAVMEQTLGALSPEARDFLFAMSVCRGPSSLEIARAVSGRPDTLDFLEDLVEASLLQASEASVGVQYSMLETIREYVAPLLCEESGDRARSRHTAYFVGRSEQLERVYSVNWLPNDRRKAAPRPKEVAEVYELEADNLRAACAWALRHDPIAAITIAANLRWFYILSGRLQEGESMLTRSLDAAPDAPSWLRAHAYVSLAVTRCWLDDFPGAREALDRGFSLMQPDQIYERRIALPFLGWVCMHERKFEEAIALLEESAKLQEAHGELWTLGSTFNILGFACLFSGRLAEARSSFNRNQELLLEVGDPVMAVHSRLGLARIAWLEGELDEAENHYRQAFQVFTAHGDRRGLAYSVEGLARVFSSREAYAESIRLAGAAQALRDRISLKRDPFDLEAYEAILRTGRGHLGPEAYAAAWREGLEDVELGRSMISQAPSK